MEAVQNSWNLELAEKCKVEQEVEVFVSDVPISDAQELEVWTTEQLSSLEDRVAKKRYDFAEETPVVLD